MSDHYTAPPQSADGETADAADINSINSATGAAFESLEAEVDYNLTLYEDYSQDSANWATYPEDQTIPGEVAGSFSSLHYAAKADDSATAASGSASSASTYASNASSSASSASSSASSASSSASAASTSASNASTYAGNAQTYATNASNSASSASGYADNAAASASAASTSASNAASAATTAVTTYMTGQPAINDFTNATHNHSDAAHGGTLSATVDNANKVYVNSGSTDTTSYLLFVGTQGGYYAAYSDSNLMYDAANDILSSKGLYVGDATMRLGASGTYTTLTSSASGTNKTITFPDATTTVVGTDTTQTLSNKTLTTPTIASFVNATHNHTDAASGGVVTTSGITTTNEAADTLTYVAFFNNTTGGQVPHTNANFTFNSSTANLSCTTFTGALTGNVTGNCSGSSGSCTGNSSTATTATSADAVSVSGSTTDTSCYVALFESSSGSMQPKTDPSIMYDASNNILAVADFWVGGNSMRLGTSGNYVTLTHAATSIRTITLPNTTCTLVGTSTTDTLSNKTLTTPTIGDFTNAQHTHSGASSGGAISVSQIDVATGTTDTITYVCIFESGSGTQQPYTDTGLYFNASTNVLTATGGASFGGYITGTLDGSCTGSSSSCTGNANSATQLLNSRTIGGVSFNGTANITPQQINISSASTSSYYIPMCSNTGNQTLYIDSGITYNAGSNVLYCDVYGDLTGDISGSASYASSAGNASSSDSVDVSSTSSTSVYPVFCSSTGSGKTMYADTSGLSYNASTNTLYMNGYEVLTTATGATSPNIAKSMSISYPITGQEFTWFYTKNAITVNHIATINLASGDSVAWTVKFASDRTLSGTTCLGSTTTSNSTGHTHTSFSDATIPAGQWVWVELGTCSGTPTEWNITLTYTED